MLGGMRKRRGGEDSRLALEEHLSHPCHDTELHQLIAGRVALPGPRRWGKEVGQEPLDDGVDRCLRGAGGSLSWSGCDEGEGLRTGLVLDGSAGEGLEAEGGLLAVATFGEGQEGGLAGYAAGGVDDLARSSVHSLCPEMPRSPMLIEHCPSHLHERAVLSFHNAVLWGSIRGRKLVIKTQVTVEGIKTRVSEFTTIVTAYCPHTRMTLIFQPQD